MSRAKNDAMRFMDGGSAGKGHFRQQHPRGCSAATFLISTQNMSPSSNLEVFPTSPRKIKETEQRIASTAAQRKTKNKNDNNTYTYDLEEMGMPITPIAHAYNRGYYPLNKSDLTYEKLTNLKNKGHAAVISTNLYSSGSKKSKSRGKHVFHIEPTETQDQIKIYDTLEEAPLILNLNDLKRKSGFINGNHRQILESFSAIRPERGRSDEESSYASDDVGLKKIPQPKRKNTNTTGQQKKSRRSK